MNKFYALALAASTLTLTGLASAEGQQIKGKNYKVNVTAGACKAGGECTATVKLDIENGYHVNEEYPYKIAVNDGEGVKYTKKAFGKQSGDFKKANEHSASIEIKFTPEKAGKATVAGTFKLAVCSDKDCQTATEAISLPVTVK